MQTEQSTTSRPANATSFDAARFSFGRNWRRFLATVDDERIQQAEQSLRDLLGLDDLGGLSFLDIGSGSGLFSVAARRLGASVSSFDYDQDSVFCTETLKERYFKGDADWQIQQGSVLNPDFMEHLPPADVVYSWGVLHHTGDMWAALEAAIAKVRGDGFFCIAIYNDQGWMSSFWHAVKRIYCGSHPGRWLITGVFVPIFALRAVLVGVIKYASPTGEFRRYKQRRGMSIVHDWLDWIGGYPFEVASFDALETFCVNRGFRIVNRRVTKRLGCNELVARRIKKGPALADPTIAT